ncbi:MAG: TetR family transcriptional regulator [Alphaproteobacteria bacterium]|nr:TetR family transcriptional regulator [Alphaproteobacteria bacterium]
MSSLRERRRKRTADTIRFAAVDLAYELGLDNVTTEMISKAAGISPRTFFNYFAYKELVFVPPALEFDQKLVNEFVTKSSNLIDDFVSMFRMELCDIDQDRDLMLKMQKIALENPKLMMLRMSAFHEYEVKLAALICQRLNCGSDNVEAQQIAAMAMVSIRVGIEHWMEYGRGRLVDSVEARIRAIPTVFDNC